MRPQNELFAEAVGDYRRTWMWAVPILVVVITLVGQLLVLLPADALGLVTRDTIETYPTVLYLIVGSFSLMALMLIAWVKLFERRTMAGIGLSVGYTSSKRYLRGYALGLAMGTFAVGGIVLAGGYELESDTKPGWVDLVPILVLMFAFGLQAGTEELIFRGWMMNRVSSRYGLVAGVVGNSLLFMLMHIELGGPESESLPAVIMFNLMTLLFSVFLSLLVIRERAIWGAAAWHAAWNWLFITWFGVPTTGIELGLTPLLTDLTASEGAPLWLSGGAIGPEGSLITLIVLGVSCVVLYRRIRTLITIQAG